MIPRELFPDVVVNGEKIATAEIAAEAQNHAEPASKPGWAWRDAARALVVRALLRQEAARRGLAPTPRELGGGRRETEEEATIRALLDAALDLAPPAEAAIRAAYDANPDRFRARDLFECSHILYAALPQDAEGRARGRARAVAALAALDRDPGAFDRIAAAESDCPSRAAGGRLGQMVAGDAVPEFEAALRGLTEGEIAAEPVETRFGHHVVRLDAWAEGARLPYQTARPRIVEALERSRWTRAARDFVDGLLAGAKIEGVTF